MRTPFMLGESDFRTMRESGFTYVDKSALIGEVLGASHLVLLLPRPRRFGKTLNLTMLKAFFDDQQVSGPLFEGLVIARDPRAMAHLNGHPTLFLSFKDMAFPTWTECQEDLVARVAGLVAEHRGTLFKLEDSVERAHYQALYAQTAPISECRKALKTIIQSLFQATGKKVVVLIDEYDNPIHEALERGYLPEILDFMRNFLGSALKDNASLERAVITGILRIAKESIYLDLNNLGIYTVLDPEFATCFGFTEEEVHQILLDQGLVEREAEVRAWYNGYRFGGATIYNPWSILTMAARPSVALQDYWLNTSGNQLVRDLILSGKAITLSEVERLLRGQPVRKRIDSYVAIRDLAPESVWSLFLFSGYLTADNYDPNNQMADLFIPNYEVRRFFERTVLQWMGSPDSSMRLIEHLLAGEMQAFAEELAESVKTILSYHDLAGKQQEKIYHVFVVGLLASLNQRYEVTSNREAGKGRYDLALIPRQPNQPGYLFEFKQSKSSNLSQSAEAALAQIADRDYTAVMRQRGTTKIFSIGLAFSGKRIALASSVWEDPGAQARTVEGNAAGTQEPERDYSGRRSSVQAAEHTQKAMLVGRIQTLQQVKGQTISSEAALMGMELAALEAFAKELAP